MPHVRQIVVVAALCVLSIAGYQTLHGSSATGAPAQTARPPVPPVLRFSGTGNVDVAPDRATIHFTTDGTSYTNLAAATDEASTAMHRVLDAVRRWGVAPSDTRTDGVSGYHDDSTGRYTATQDLTVTVRDIAHTGKLLAAGIAAGAHANYGPEFSLADQQAGMARALKAAIDNSRAKADAAAAAAGLQVTGVVSVVENGGYRPYYPQTYDAATLTAARAAVVPVRRGTQRQSATVTVTFSYTAA